MLYAGSTRPACSGSVGRLGLLLLLVLGLSSGCSSEPVLYGKAADIGVLRSTAVSLGEAPQHGHVVVEGEVGQVCKMGCWFYLLDDKTLRHVDLDLGSGFVIPNDSIGQRALVVGTLSSEKADRSLQAETVVLFRP